MTKLLLVASFASLAVIGCQRKEAKPLETTLRLRAEKAACGLNAELFKAPEKSVQLSSTKFKNLKLNEIKDGDDEKVKEAKAKKNGVYTLKEAEVFRYVYGKQNGVLVNGSSRRTFTTETGWANNSVATSEVCGSSKLVDLKASGIESFELPNMKIASKFGVDNDKCEKKPTTAADVDDLSKKGPGNEPDEIAKSNISRSWYQLPEDSGYFLIEYEESRTTITVTRAKYTKSN